MSHKQLRSYGGGVTSYEYHPTLLSGSNSGPLNTIGVVYPLHLGDSFFEDDLSPDMRFLAMWYV